MPIRSDGARHKLRDGEASAYDPGVRQADEPCDAISNKLSGATRSAPLAACHRWPRDCGILHAGKARIAAVVRGADGNITKDCRVHTQRSD